MNQPSTDPPRSIDPPSPDQATMAITGARDLFARTLAGWASDALRLRRSGLDEAGWRDDPATRTWRDAA